MGLTDVFQRKNRRLIDYVDTDKGRVIYTSAWPKTQRLVPGAPDETYDPTPSLPPRPGPMEYIPEPEPSHLEKAVAEQGQAAAEFSVELSVRVPSKYSSPYSSSSFRRFLGCSSLISLASLAGSVMIGMYDTSPQKLMHAAATFVGGTLVGVLGGLYGVYGIEGFSLRKIRPDYHQTPSVSPEQHPPSSDQNISLNP
ncbi:MAG: hypothetical protein Q7R76_01530 [Candidatus Woesearchaeota archaeon]|nr:hypothetical protein [Candidatus Woesearchaeota archaeon]